MDGIIFAPTWRPASPPATEVILPAEATSYSAAAVISRGALLGAVVLEPGQEVGFQRRWSLIPKIQFIYPAWCTASGSRRVVAGRW